MKSFLALCLIVNSSLILASETCYKAETKTPDNIPQTFCLSGASLDVNSGELSTTGSDQATPKTLKNVSLIRNTEDSYKFVTTKTIYDYLETVCGESILAELEIKGQSDVYGQVDEKTLSLTVNYETQNDSCHSMPATESYSYKLVK